MKIISEATNEFYDVVTCDLDDIPNYPDEFGEPGDEPEPGPDN